MTQNNSFAGSDNYILHRSKGTQKDTLCTAICDRYRAGR